MEDQQDPGVAAWAAFLRAHAAVVRVLEREVEQQTGLPLTWYDVLLELNAAKDRRLRMRQLAERVVLSRTRVSRLVEEMVRAGMVDRQADPVDARATFAAITDRGRRALREAAPVYLDGIRRHFAQHLTEAQLRALKSGLEQILTAHQATAGATSSRNPGPEGGRPFPLGSVDRDAGAGGGRLGA